MNSGVVLSLVRFSSALIRNRPAGTCLSCWSGRRRNGWSSVSKLRNYYATTTSRVSGTPTRAEAQDVAEEYGEEDFEDSSWKFGPQGTGLITRNNKRWLTKKSKKVKAVKIQEYKEIRDSTYDEIAAVYPQILEFDREEVKKLMADCAMYGFSPTKVAKILSRYPEFMDKYEVLLPKSAKAWRSIGFSESDRVTIFHRNPALMNVEPADVGKGYSFLSLTFSNKELIHLLKNCPQVIVEDEGLLQEKIDLLWKTYSHSTLAVAKSDAMSSDNFRIKFRHEFLIRSGFFKAMSFHKFLKFQAECDRTRMVKERDKYFTPSQIVCTSDEKFLDVCTKNALSLTELSVFETLFMREERDAELNSWLDEEEDPEALFEADEEQDESEEGSKDDDEARKGVRKLPSFHHQPWRYSCYGTNSIGLFNVVDNVEFYF